MKPYSVFVGIVPDALPHGLHQKRDTMEPRLIAAFSLIALLILGGSIILVGFLDRRREHDKMIRGKRKFHVSSDLQDENWSEQDRPSRRASAGVSRPSRKRP